jgi:hypothetical protein
MNRFRVPRGPKLPSSKSGCLAAVILLCRVSPSQRPEAEDHTLYASHTVWECRAVFEASTKSEAFRAAPSWAGDNEPLYLDHPQFEGFEVRQTVGRGKTVGA